MAGRPVLLSLSTAHRASDERWLAGLRELGKRSLHTPVPITPDGAPGLIQAIALLWPRALRRRGWVPKRQNLAAHGPPQAWPAFKACGVARRAAPRVEEGPRRFAALRA